MTVKTYVRFERGRDDIVGPTFGPYDVVQLTYCDLRAINEDGRDFLLGHYNDEANEWWPESAGNSEHVDFSSCHNIDCDGGAEVEKALKIWYSDVIIFSDGE